MLLPSVKASGQAVRITNKPRWIYVHKTFVSWSAIAIKLLRSNVLPFSVVVLTACVDQVPLATSRMYTLDKAEESALKT